MTDIYVYVLRDRSYLNIMKDIQEVSNLLLNFSTLMEIQCEANSSAHEKQSYFYGNGELKRRSVYIISVRCI